MNPAALRVGSVEIVAALVLFAAIAAYPRTRRFRDASDFAPIRVTLDVLERGAAARRFVAVAPLIVGRSSACDLVLMDPQVSRRHVRFDAQSGVLYLSDVGSSNGTFLNGRRLDGAIEVRTGDTIDVGTTRLTVVGQERWQ